jgi:hypothetical protein
MTDESARRNDWLTAKEAAGYAKVSVQAIYLGVKRKNHGE